MKLLVVTQAVDKHDPALGFFVRWIAELSKHYEAISVICLYEGEHSLPRSVHVHSLGKERGNVGRGRYALRFLSLIWRVRGEYDAVFVHMNQEYVLLGGLFWKLFGKTAYLWRNHYKGSFLTNLAVALCTKVFCTSKHSYTARFKKTVIMPVGVDTETFTRMNGARNPRSILSLGRISPSKQVHVLLEALRLLNEKNVTFTADIYGSTLPKDEEYLNELKRSVQKYHLSGRVQINASVSHEYLPAIYAVHEIFVNMSPSGMLDKTIYEAAASGCRVIAASRDFAEVAGNEYAFKEGDAQDLAAKLEASLDAGAAELTRIVHDNSLHALGARLALEMAI